MPRGNIERRHRFAGVSCGGKVASPLFWIDDERTYVPVHLASVGASCTGIGSVCEQRMAEAHPGTVEGDEVTVLGGAQVTPHAWSEQAFEQLQRRIREHRDRQQRPLDVGAEPGEPRIHDRLEACRQ